MIIKKKQAKLEEASLVDKSIVMTIKGKILLETYQ